jgi:hypothetical protein
MMLEQQRPFFISFDFLPCREKILAPRVSITLRPLIDNAADTEAVVTLVAERAGWKLSAFGTRLNKLPLRCDDRETIATRTLCTWRRLQNGGEHCHIKSHSTLHIRPFAIHPEFQWEWRAHSKKKAQSRSVPWS